MSEGATGALFQFLVLNNATQSISFEFTFCTGDNGLCCTVGLGC